MTNQRRSIALISAIPVLSAALIVGLVSVLPTREAQATPAYAAQTKLPCGKCHVNPAGGGTRTDFGNKFQANGHKLP